MDQYAVPDEGLAAALDTLVRLALGTDQPLQLRLFVNDLVPQRTTVLANYTEATFAGYSRRTLNRADWGVSVLEADHVARITLSAGPLIYTPTVADVTVYGVYIIDPAAGIVRYARRFTVPRVTAAGVPFAVNPVITVRSEVAPG